MDPIARALEILMEAGDSVEHMGDDHPFWIVNGLRIVDDAGLVAIAARADIPADGPNAENRPRPGDDPTRPGGRRS